MRIAISLFCLFIALFSITTNAATIGGNNYVALSGIMSYYELHNTDTNAKNPIGSGFSLYAGRKFMFVAGEGFIKRTEGQTNYSRPNNGGVVKIGLEDRAVGFGGRLMVMFFSAKLGYAFHNYKIRLTQNDLPVAHHISLSGSGMYGGLGFRVPLYVFDIFGEYTRYIAGKSALDELEAGVRFYF